MPTLEHDRLVFRFPRLDAEASFSINFQRTLRIPDSDETYPLPPGLGSFPLRHVEDFAAKLPEPTKARGGVMLPMWQAEAMWLNFIPVEPARGLSFPVAVKVAAGKINAVTGEPWRAGLHRGPQDYMVSPEQPWLDGFAVARGVIRQFVAMPLGEGHSVEEQLTGEAEWGGLQISVTPLKPSAWRAHRAAWEERQRFEREMSFRMSADGAVCASVGPSQMGLAAGGRMRQSIARDPFRLEDWDVAAAERVFVTLVHARDWKAITGEPARNEPPTAAQYSSAGLPWFDHYGADHDALPGAPSLAGVKSLGQSFKDQTGADLPNSADVNAKPKFVVKFGKLVRNVSDLSGW